MLKFSSVRPAAFSLPIRSWARSGDAAQYPFVTQRVASPKACAKDGGIEPTYPEERVRTLVLTAARIALLHFITACEHTDHEESVTKLAQAFALLPD